MSVFGQIVLPQQVEQAITDLLKTWMPKYLGEMERITGRQPGKLPAVRAWGFGDVEDRLSEQIEPAVFVECAKAAMLGTSDGYTAVWDTTVAVIVKSDQKLSRARELAGIYTTAVSLILIQQPLGIGTIGWDDQDYGVLDAQTRRFLARGESSCTTTIPQAAQTEAGPTDPDLPPGEYPKAETIGLTVDLEP
jgi:hypothetical protein